MIKITGFIPQNQFINCMLPAVLMTVIAGCASPDAARHIKNFSDATILTVSNTTLAFKLVEDNYYKEEVSEEVKNFDNKPGFDQNTIQPFMDSNALQVRLDVLNGLKSYAANLSALMGNSSLTNFDQNTTKLGSALSAIDTNLVKDSFFKTAPATAQELQIFTTAINALGRWLITCKEHKEAKQIIASMQQPVADICQLLHKDFEILGQQLKNENEQTYQNENRYILDNLSHFDNNPGEKRAEIQELAALTRETREDAAIFASLESATAKLAAAHRSLNEVFSKDTTNIGLLINELSTESQRISKYYSSLQTSK